MTELVECACGCGNLRPKYTISGIQRRYIKGHQFRGMKHSEQSKIKMSLSKVGKNNPSYLSGRIINTQGYILILNRSHPNALNGKYVYEHRFVMEQHLGRLLTSKEEIHHINGVRDDNRIENLRLFASKSEHKIHDPSNKNIWSHNEKEILKDLYPTASKDHLLSQLYPRSWNAIKKKAWILRITRSQVSARGSLSPRSG